MGQMNNGLTDTQRLQLTPCHAGEQMDQQGISSRTQSDPGSQQLVDNVVIVVGAGQTSRRKQTQSVSNSDIVVGASMTQVNTLNSTSNQTSRTVDQSADPCR